MNEKSVGWHSGRAISTGSVFHVIIIRKASVWKGGLCVNDSTGSQLQGNRSLLLKGPTERGFPPFSIFPPFLPFSFFFFSFPHFPLSPPFPPLFFPYPPFSFPLFPPLFLSSLSPPFLSFFPFFSLLFSLSALLIFPFFPYFFPFYFYFLIIFFSFCNRSICLLFFLGSVQRSLGRLSAAIRNATLGLP